MEGFDAALVAWQPFFAAQLTAAATLLGLLFVGLSINLARILAFPALPLRAEIALVLMLLQLAVAAIALVPDQPAPAFATEIVVAALVAWTITATRSLKARRLGHGSAPHPLLNFVLLQIAVVPFLVGGMLAFAEVRGALHLIAAGMIFCIVKAAIDAWVLLVEINR